ncbi:hypothetical protein MAGR_66920 [Mycolicibacterium agri]|uniref:Uncharacterized protein n=1 Tax=Mycolicibacterium agri TaxID=36811 RepID=A0A7I9WC03_MYCAG|nr:hypothetical protein MAGR_66920 [Mycolicibacterium agri]
MNDTGIVRNRMKIEATIANARAAADLDVDLGELLWSFAPPKRPRPADLSQVPAVTRNRPRWPRSSSAGASDLWARRRRTR